MGDVLPTPPQESGRPRSLSIAGWAFFGIACWMTLSVVMYLAVSGLLVHQVADSPMIGSKVWGVLAWVELVLGPAMIVTSLRFLQRRRWARIPLMAFGAVLATGTLAFGVFWVTQLLGFFGETRKGPPLDGTGSVVFGVFQVIMSIGGLAICLAFAACFAFLAKRLCSAEVCQTVTLEGF